MTCLPAAPAAQAGSQGSFALPGVPSRRCRDAPPRCEDGNEGGRRGKPRLLLGASFEDEPTGPPHPLDHGAVTED